MAKKRKVGPKAQSILPAKKNGVILWVLLIISIVFIARTNLYRIVNIYDEGNIVYGSQLVSEGAVPYKDFWSIYAPAQYYCTALLFKVFGASVTTERVWDLLLRTALVMVIFIVAWRISGIYFALLSWLTALIWLGYWEWNGYPAIPALLFCLISLEFLRRFHEAENKAGLFYAGLFCGVTSLFRVDFGVYTFISAVVAVASMNALKTTKNIRYFDGFQFYFYGLLAVIIIPLIYFLSVVGPGELYYDLIRYPAFIQPAYRFLNFPDPLGLVKGSFFENFPYYYPFIIYILSGFFLYVVISAKKGFEDLKGRALALLPFIFAGILYSVQLKNRSDYAHLEPFLLMAVLLQAFVYLRVFGLSGSYKYGILAVLFTANVLLMVFPGTDIITRLGRHVPEQSVLKRAGRAALNGDMLKAIEFVRSKTTDKDYIFCGNTYHDRIIGNDIMSYFLAERRSATKYFCLDPGSADTPAVQKRIVADLTSKNVKYIMLLSAFEGATEPNKSSVSSGCFVLDDFIKGNFVKVWGSEPFSVLERK